MLFSASSNRVKHAFNKKILINSIYTLVLSVSP